MHLRGVTKHAFDEKRGAQYMLRDVSVSIHRDARLALLGPDQAALTTVLHLLAGSETPDQGLIVAHRLRPSPVINSGSWAGGSLAPQLSGIENINFFAGTHGLDRIHLTSLVEAACQFGKLLRVPVREYDRKMRQTFEVALIAAIPYDCYFVDRMNEFGGRLVWQLFHVASGRGAGIVFSTNNVKQAAMIGQFGAVVRDGSIRCFGHIKEAIADYEQR
jgi:ABC-type polysaccharide/polyol phosphate transport system ATPase subunit